MYVGRKGMDTKQVHLYYGVQKLSSQFRAIYFDSQKRYRKFNFRRPDDVWPYEVRLKDTTVIIPFKYELSRSKLPPELKEHLSEANLRIV